MISENDANVYRKCIEWSAKLEKRKVNSDGERQGLVKERGGLYTLELRRLQADICLCYNILHNKIETPISNFLKLITLILLEVTAENVKVNLRDCIFNIVF